MVVSSDIVGFVTPEKLRQGISTVAFVIPMFNEATNLPGLADMFAKQQLPPGVKLEVILSDNGSTDSTPELAQKLVIPGVKVTYVDTSQKNSVGSARKTGTDTFMKAHETDANEAEDDRIIVSFDADTRLLSHQFVNKIVSLFSNKQLMVAYGSIGLRPAKGNDILGPSKIQRFITQELLRELFVQNGRRVKDYLNPPHDIFAGVCTIMRQSAYQATSGYHDEHRGGEDLQLSLELQSKFSSPSQIVFDEELGVVTSARGRETRRGTISYAKLFKQYIDVMWRSRDYMLGAWRSVAPKDNDRLKTAHSKEVVRQFIQRTDAQLYGLEASQEIGKIITLSEREARERTDVKPQINATTKQPIPHRYVIIRRKEGLREERLAA